MFVPDLQKVSHGINQKKTKPEPESKLTLTLSTIVSVTQLLLRNLIITKGQDLNSHSRVSALQDNIAQDF